jgi:hypothetical protein
MGGSKGKMTIMILLNKLIRTDVVLVLAVVLLLLVRVGFWRGFLEGAAAVLLFLSIVNHIEHYQRTKKLY